jgi:hypothetical protein
MQNSEVLLQVVIGLDFKIIQRQGFVFEIEFKPSYIEDYTEGAL